MILSPSIFTKLQTIWDDLLCLRIQCKYTCGALCPLVEDSQTHYVLSFLLGMNDSFFQLHHQILIMDPIPLPTKFFHCCYKNEKKTREIFCSPPLLSLVSV